MFPFLVGTACLCAALLVPGLLAGALAATVDLSVKRSALIVMAGTAWLLAGRKPAWLWDLAPARTWRDAVGERGARWALVAVGVLALLLAAVFPLPWLRVLR